MMFWTALAFLVYVIAVGAAAVSAMAAYVDHRPWWVTAGYALTALAMSAYGMSLMTDDEANRPLCLRGHQVYERHTTAKPPGEFITKLWVCDERAR